MIPQFSRPFWSVLSLCAGLMVHSVVYAGDWRSPLEVPGARSISVQQAAELHAAGVPFIDVRNPRLYARRHVPGAHHLDLKDAFTEQTLSEIVARDRPLVIYCSGAMCSRSSRASEKAVSWGFDQVHYFRGGIADWRDAGLPLDSGD